MAVSFRHGGNGSYKSAYAVWFEILPALRAGRLVVTNIEGLRSLESIESLLDEKFPSSARLIRIFSRSVEGVELWQNWFSWMPIGALIVIDECQDLFTKKVGFNMEKVNYKPLDSFLENLPKDFSDYFHSRWQPHDPTKFDDGDIDDTGRTQLDEKNRLLYPFNFYGAFMRHRKYQWDIVMLTPDWTAIDTSLRGCAQSAFGHRSTDTFFRKRRPRIYSHLPNTTATKPTKADSANVTSLKIPLEVFALYKSTGTGGFNSSNADLTMLKQPKLWGSFLVLVLCLGYLIYGVTNVFFSSDENTIEEVTKDSQSTKTVSEVQKPDSGNIQQTDKAVSKDIDLLVPSNDYNEVNTGSIHPVNAFTKHFPNFDSANGIYISSVNKVIKGVITRTEYLFMVDGQRSKHYISSDALERMGYRFKSVDDCMVMVTYGKGQQLVMCTPQIVTEPPQEAVALTSGTLSTYDVFTSG